MTLRNFPQLGFVLLLAGCAATAPRVQSGQAAATPAPRAFTDPDQAIAYHVFMGELAQGRGDAKVAVSEYQAAATLSADPTLSAHAALLAYENGDIADGLELA